MTLSIFIGQSEVKMELVRRGRIIDFETALYYHNLDSVLITALDKLLKRNILDTKVLKSYKILGNLGKNSTSRKIVAAFIEGLKTFMK